MSTRNTARFENQTFVAARPEVLPLLKDIMVCYWGYALEFRGTEAELIAAGLASSEMFEGHKPRSQRSTRNEFGDKYKLKRLRHTWVLEMDVNAELFYGWLDRDPADLDVVKDILKRFERPGVPR